MNKKIRSLLTQRSSELSNRIDDLKNDLNLIKEIARKRQAGEILTEPIARETRLEIKEKEKHLETIYRVRELLGQQGGAEWQKEGM